MVRVLVGAGPASDDNHFKRLDISDARELVGYQPQDDATELNPALEKLNLDDRVLSASQQDPSRSRASAASCKTV